MRRAGWISLAVIGIAGVAGGIALSSGEDAAPRAAGTVAALIPAGSLASIIFVPDAAHGAVSAISTASDTVVAVMDLGLRPDSFVVSDDAGVIAATDRESRRLVIVDPATGAERARLALDFEPADLLLSPDGYLVAAADLAGGTVAFVSLLTGTEIARAGGLGPLSDITFEAGGAFLFAARADRSGIVGIDVVSGAIVSDFAAASGTAATLGITALARTPTGRLGFAKLAGSGAIAVVDLLAGEALSTLRAGWGADRAYSTSYGRYIVLADEDEASIALVSTTSLEVVARLPGTTDAGGMNTGFLETVAFIADRTGQRLIVIDLSTLSAAGSIALPGTPGQGATTGDGLKLYVPLEEGGVAVIDTRARTLLTVVPTPGLASTEVATARSLDICH